MQRQDSKSRKLLSRRNVLAGLAASGCAASAVGAGVFDSPDSRLSAPLDLLWGVCGHPFRAYPGISWADQLDMVRQLGFTHYRVDIASHTTEQIFEELLGLAHKRGVTIVPILHCPVNLTDETTEVLYQKSFDHARRFARSFRSDQRIWELGNELENFAIIQPCEQRDDGTTYPCEWGPAGGIGPLEYYGPRWKKVSAVLKGLTEGVRAGDSKSIRAVGTAGWGHLGAFDRLKADAIDWDITVWHDYPKINEEFLAKLASFGKPIWITEFNAGGGGTEPPDVNASMLAERIAYYRSMREKYNLAAAFIYELLDETYWGDTFEARQGLVAIKKREGYGWAIDSIKPAGYAVQKAIKK